jgi:hypothetical protein
MIRAMLSIGVLTLLGLAGCGPSKSEQATQAMLAEIKKSNAEHGEAIRARCAQLGAAADLLQNPAVTAAMPANTHFEIYPEFYSGGPWGEAAKAATAGETVRVAVVRWNDLDGYSATGVKNEPADDLTFLCRPLGFYYDVKKVKTALADPAEFSDIENYRRLRELLLNTRYVLALQQLDYQDGKLEAGSGASVFTPGHVAFRAALIDIEQPAVLATGEGEATNSDRIETRFYYKDDGSNAKDEAARKAAEDGLRDDLRKRSFAALEQTLQSMVAGAGTSADDSQVETDSASESSDSKLESKFAPDEKVSDPYPSDSQLSDSNPDTKLP